MWSCKMACPSEDKHAVQSVTHCTLFRHFATLARITGLDRPSARLAVIHQRLQQIVVSAGIGSSAAALAIRSLAGDRLPIGRVRAGPLACLEILSRRTAATIRRSIRTLDAFRPCGACQTAAKPEGCHRSFPSFHHWLPLGSLRSRTTDTTAKAMNTKTNKTLR